jgi:hypothetical protein
MCTWQAVVTLLVCCLPLYAAQERETGWSNGRQPATGWRQVKGSKCKSGHFKDTWRVGVATLWLADGATKQLAVVSLEPRCSDGRSLQALAGDKAVEQHDVVSKSSLNASAGYSCANLVDGSYNNVDNFLATFMYFGQLKERGTNLKPVQFICYNIPADYVAVGYSGAAGMAVDGLKFIMAPFPQPSPSPAPQSSQSLNKSVSTTEAGSRADAKPPSSSDTPSPVQVPAAVTPADPKTLSIQSIQSLGRGSALRHRALWVCQPLLLLHTMCGSGGTSASWLQPGAGVECDRRACLANNNRHDGAYSSSVCHSKAPWAHLMTTCFSVGVHHTLCYMIRV